MRNKVRFSAKDLAAIIENMVLMQKVDEALALIDRVELEQFLPQILKALKRATARQKSYNTCTIMSSQPLTEEALDSVLSYVEYDKTDVLKQIVSPAVGVGVTVSYKDKFIDATLAMMLARALTK
jgi:F0F1-type ATP synthase delta subunit